MSDLIERLNAAADLAIDVDPLRLQVAVESVIAGHGEFPPGWCVTCGRDFPCVTLRGVAVALGVCEDPED